MLLAGTYKGQISNWGIKWFAEKDEYKAFIEFEIPDMSNEKTTWMSSVDRTEKMGKNGKPYSFYNMTMGALKKAGFQGGEDLGLLVDSPDALEMGKMFSITVTDSFGKDGKKYTNTNFEPLNADGTAVVKAGKGIELEGSEGAAKLRAKLGITQAPEQKVANDGGLPF